MFLDRRGAQCAWTAALQCYIICHTTTPKTGADMLVIIVFSFLIGIVGLLTVAGGYFGPMDGWHDDDPEGGR